LLVSANLAEGKTKQFSALLTDYQLFFLTYPFFDFGLKLYKLHSKHRIVPRNIYCIRSK